MKETLRRILTSFILCLFVNFVFSNSVFIHSHVAADGRLVTHSHPYIPTAGHGHSAMQLDQIASFNASAASVNVVADTAVPTPEGEVAFINTDYSSAAISHIAAAGALRGPPSDLIA